MPSVTINPSGGDDTAAIQSNLDAGNDVILGAGVFILIGTASGYALNIPAGRSLSGAGRDNTLLRLASAALTSCEVVRINQVSNVTVSDLSIDGGRGVNGVTVAGACINISEQSNYVDCNVVLQNLHLYNGPLQQIVLNSAIGVDLINVKTSATTDPVAASHGVDIDAVASAKPCDTITITDCDFDSWGQESFKAENTKNLTISGTRFRQFVSLVQDATNPYSVLENVEFNACTFEDFIALNRLKQDPTNLYAGAGNVTFDGCVFSGNSALIWGLDSTAAHYGVITITDCVFNGRNSYILPAGVSITASGNSGVKSYKTHYARSVASPKHTGAGYSSGLSPYYAASVAAANVQNAISQAVSGEDVFVLDGTYTGAGNYSITNGNNNYAFRIIAESLHGVILDGTGLNSVSAFSFAGTNTQKVIVDGFYIKNFTLGTSGRGILLNAAAVNAEFHRVKVENCGDANTGGGGGVRIQDATYAKIYDCDFIDCITSAAHAGGVLVDDGTVIITGSRFENCVAAGTVKSGGGIYAGSGTNIVNMTLTGCSFTGCTATGSGGAVTVSSANASGNTFTLANLTCVNNSATTSAPDLNFYLNNAAVTATLKNSIAYSTGTPVVKSGTGGTLTATYNCIRGGYTGTGNISTDPQISSDLTLPSTSPCIGTGSNWWGTAPNPVGSDGEPFQDIKPDMGAIQNKHHWLHPSNI